MKDDVFIDPTAVTPKQLTESEMADLSGGMPIIVFATICSEALLAVVVGGVITVGG